MFRLGKMLTFSIKLLQSSARQSKQKLLAERERESTAQNVINGGYLRNFQFFRHEVPVADSRIRVIRMTEDLVVVDKPASIPVHPCGRYRHNTVVFILAKEQGLKNLRTIHRWVRHIIQYYA